MVTLPSGSRMIAASGVGRWARTTVQPGRRGRCALARYGSTWSTPVSRWVHPLQRVSGAEVTGTEQIRRDPADSARRLQRGRGRLTAALDAALAGGPAVLPLGPAASIEVEAEPDPGTAVVIMTSGSTGEPKLVQLPASALRASARADARPARRSRALAARAARQHVAGVQVIVRSLLAGHRPVVPGPARRVPAGRLRRRVRRAGGRAGRRYTSLVPDPAASGCWTPAAPALDAAARLPRGTRRRGRAGLRRCGTRALARRGAGGDHLRDERDRGRLRLRRGAAGRGAGPAGRRRPASGSAARPWPAATWAGPS